MSHESNPQQPEQAKERSNKTRNRNGVLAAVAMGAVGLWTALTGGNHDQVPLKPTTTAEAKAATSDITSNGEVAVGSGQVATKLSGGVEISTQPSIERPVATPEQAEQIIGLARTLDIANKSGDGHSVAPEGDGDHVIVGGWFDTGKDGGRLRYDLVFPSSTAEVEDVTRVRVISEAPGKAAVSSEFNRTEAGWTASELVDGKSGDFAIDTVLSAATEAVDQGYTHNSAHSR